MKTICFIPARGGSVRLPKKNIRLFHGKAIICYSIENARKSGLFDEIVVSTDDQEIARIARRAGADIAWRALDDGSLGTQELAGKFLRDDHRGQGAALCCVLYPCAPLLNWAHLVEGWRTLLHAPGSLFAYTTNEAHEDIGAFYWGFAQAFRGEWDLGMWGEQVVMHPERCCDINTEADFQRAERMYEEMHRGD